ncbi:MAG: ABC transporter ATP-binding protein [Eubacteriales bacterium]|nr:ABC transporter ATP-binding protein [Eubacteriales bacterium]
MNKNSSKVIKLLYYLKEYRFYLFVYIVVGLLYRLLPFISSFILSHIIGCFIIGENIWEGFFFIIGICAVFRAIGRYADTWISHDIAYRILAELRIKLYKKLEELAPAYLIGNRTGNLLSIMQEDVNLLEWFYAHTFGTYIVSILLVVIALAVLTIIHPLVLLSVLPFICLLIVVYLLFDKNRTIGGKEVRGKLGAFGAEIADSVQGIKDITVYNWHEEYRNKLNKSRNAYEEARIIDGRWRGLEKALERFLMALTSLSTLFVVALLVNYGEVRPDLYLVAVVISGAVLNPISEMLSMSSQFGVIFAAAERVLSILEREPLVRDSGIEELTLSDEFKISFHEVAFTYPGEKTKALKRVSFDISSGQMVALAGVSGSGKSTIANLLQRFYDVQSGSICINDNDIRIFTLKSLRDAIAVVPQDIYLFNVSILENIKLGNSEASFEMVKEAAEMAMADELINELPNGFSTIAGERATKISGGQKQRIAIARAFLKKSKILILDEASSNLDSNNEQYLNQTLQKLKKHCTIIVIAHRTSTLKAADKIVFIQEGAVNAVGTYHTLMKDNSDFQIMVGSKRKEGN